MLADVTMPQCHNQQPRAAWKAEVGCVGEVLALFQPCERTVAKFDGSLEHNGRKTDRFFERFRCSRVARRPAASQPRPLLSCGSEWHICGTTTGRPGWRLRAWRRFCETQKQPPRRFGRARLRSHRAHLRFGGIGRLRP